MNRIIIKIDAFEDTLHAGKLEGFGCFPGDLCLASKPVNYEAEQKVDGCKKRLECGDPQGADSEYTAWYQTLPGIIADREREGEHGAVACAVTAPVQCKQWLQGTPPAAGAVTAPRPSTARRREVELGARCGLPETPELHAALDAERCRRRQSRSR
ncbi:hypothetical protein NDU88_005881 [Pleurodeles waltl]|uniref:Uncharacterized protein n=1 Tax=Pleurodeles waltl TaxID=8319 RepID=A0AAV7W986_PLEWA|nr:hypothetical protein NDU88_005881 [Pleurodeles waltl]